MKDLRDLNEKRVRDRARDIERESERNICSVASSKRKAPLMNERPEEEQTTAMITYLSYNIGIILIIFRKNEKKTQVELC
jgi:hypothetical protein